jgi:ABC-type lipoprotein export system ATPase subunit
VASGSASPLPAPLPSSPAIVLADEPTANLDKATGREILSLMKQINRHLKTTFIFSTHDQKVIDRADRLIQMEDGYITAFRDTQRDREKLDPGAQPYRPGTR